MKDECNGKNMIEFIGIRPKNYCTVMEDLKESKKAKGIKKACIKNSITSNDYRSCVLGYTITNVSFNLIRSKNHKIGSINVQKSALCPYDDKRYVCDDGINTLAHGHYKITDIDGHQ